MIDAPTLPSRRAHQGQVLVLFALSSLVLLAAMGLVLDGGYNFAMRREMQNAADAAALAGSQLLAGDTDSTQILAVVQSVAVQNGVPDASDVTCQYVTDANLDGVASCTADAAPPTNMGTITGVRVAVAEEHGTFALRLIGIFESGTGANAVSQVQRLSEYSGTGSPFAPCGVETKLVNEVGGNGVFSILTTELTPVYGTGSKKDTIIDYTVTVVNDEDGYASIDPAAYSFDWTGGLGLGLPKPGPGVDAPEDKPNFLIHGPQIESCGVHSSSWKGLNGTQELTLPALAYDDTTHNGHRQSIWAEPGTKAGPSRAAAGLYGCGADESDGCIMILPIVDNSGPGGNGTNAYIAGRLWGAFWVTQVSANEHAGRLIANYPIVGDGSDGWSASYSGPVVIRLVR
jgi:hypothetical protein